MLLSLTRLSNRNMSVKVHYVVLGDKFGNSENEVIIHTQKYFVFPKLTKQAVLRGKSGPQNTV